MRSRRFGPFKRSLALTALLLLAGLHRHHHHHGSDAPTTHHHSEGGDGGESGGGARHHAHSNAPVGQQQASLTTTATGTTARPRGSEGSGSPEATTSHGSHPGTDDPSNRYNSNGDPMRELGPGQETHPEEWNSLVSEAESLGVEVRYREGGIFYAPGTSRGSPGQINIDPDASYSALMHEMSHVRDDHAAGWRGFEGVYDQDFLADSERRAYQVEIDYANEINRPDLAEALTGLRDDRIAEIYGG